MAFRISLMRMYFSTLKMGETPTPFAEIRTFMFLKRKPSVMRTKELRIHLLTAINQTENLLEGLQAGIEQGKTGGKDNSAEMKLPTRIRLIPPTTQRRVMIEGLEVERTDILDMPQGYEGIFQSRKFTQARGVEWRYFSKRAEREVSGRRVVLPLNFNKIYRYFARFNEEGKINWEYDEAQIRMRLEPAKEMVDQREMVRTRLIKLITQVKTADIMRDIGILQELTRKLEELRG